MAVRRRRPRRAIVYSDQGSQWSSDDWRKFCKRNYLELSMNRRGSCSDNAAADSFFCSLKKERIKKRIQETRELALAEISDYSDFLTIQPAAMVIWAVSVLRNSREPHEDADSWHQMPFSNERKG